MLASALLGQQIRFGLQQTVIPGLLNAAAALPMFHVLDKLRERNG